MRKVIVSELITLDGVIEAPGGEPNFKYTGWSVDYVNEEYIGFKLEELQTSAIMILGRITYQSFKEGFEGQTDELGFADRMNSITKFVVSTTLNEADWANTTLINQNVIAEIAALRAQEGDPILVAGSQTLVQTLIENDLVDEYRLMVHPVVLGIGRTLFGSVPARVKLKLTGTKPFSNGIVVMTYEPDRS